MAKAKQKRGSNGRFVANESGINHSKTNGKSNGSVFEMLSNMQSGDKADLLFTVNHLRGRFLQELYDHRRDIDEEAGYMKELKAENYKQMYIREGIARRIIDVLPKETWKNFPTIKETDESEETEFEKAVKNCCNLIGQNKKSFYKSEVFNPLWDFCKRVDILSGIGQFGVMLLGFNDVETPDQMRRPVAGVAYDELSQVKDMVGEEPIPKVAAPKLNFIQVFDESQIRITRYETNQNSPRFNCPVLYQLDFYDPNNRSRASQGAPVQTLEVHWTRIIHVVDSPESNELFHAPRLEALWNRSYDLVKYYAAGGEGYWRGAFPGLAVESHPSMAGDIDIEDEDAQIIKEQIHDYQHKLQRYLFFLGLSVKTLAPTVVDFTPQVDAVISAICITLGIPKRVFLGSEQGELASTQDSKAWRERIYDRRVTQTNVRIIRPLIDRLILVGVLPTPSEGYMIEWIEGDSMSAKESSQVALMTTKLLAEYVKGNLNTVMTFFDFLTRIVGMAEGEANVIIENAEKQKPKVVVDPVTGASVAEGLSEGGDIVQGEIGMTDRQLGGTGSGEREVRPTIE